MTTICTFNANNLYLRYRFGQMFPGDIAGKSRIEDPGKGYLPGYDPALFELFNPVQRDLAARALTSDWRIYADVVCLQEIESLLALRKFNEEHLRKRYDYAVLIDSRDHRQIDVAVLSDLPILGVRTHVDDRDPRPDDRQRPWLFSRDCLEVEIALNQPRSRRLTLFINHFKSKFVDFRKANTPAKRRRARAKGDALRRRQAEAVVDIIRARFPGARFDEEWFAVIGDLNDQPGSEPVRPLVRESGLRDALGRIPTEEDRWTHWYRSENTVSQLSYMLLSPALDAASAGRQPRIERRGISFSRILQSGEVGPRVTHFHRVDSDPNASPVSFQFPRFSQVSPDDFASDHCPVFFEVSEEA